MSPNMQRTLAFLGGIRPIIARTGIKPPGDHSFSLCLIQPRKTATFEAFADISGWSSAVWLGCHSWTRENRTSGPLVRSAAEHGAPRKRCSRGRMGVSVPDISVGRMMYAEAKVDA